jgi:hypothetical protein
MIARSTAIPLSQHTQQRLLEILPGALTWFALLVPVVAAFTIRLNDDGMLWILGVGAVVLDAYWLVRTTVTVLGVRKTLKALEATEKIDWLGRCQELEASLPDGAPAPSEIVHCALIPTYTESYDVLRATVAALAATNYPDQLRICAIITRETDAGGVENVTRLREEFAGSFRLFLHIKDPLLPGIVVGKSAAMAYGGPVLKAACDELGLDPARTMVTDLDSDFRVHPQYFAYLTFQFCSAQDRLVSIWQPVPVFLNNIWRVPVAVRVMATAATQWQMFLHQHPHRLVMFSSYSMSLDLLASVGYWDSDVIPEDSRFFWKAFFHTGGKLNTRPAFLPVYGDAPRARGYAATHASQYNQIKRWAWGATDIPYVTSRMSPPRDPVARARAPLREPDLQPPDVGDSSAAALLRRIAARVHRSGLQPLVHVGVAWQREREHSHHHVVEHAPARAGGLPDFPETPRVAVVAAAMGGVTAVDLSGRRARAERHPRPRGADAAHVRRVSRISRHREGVAPQVSARALSGTCRRSSRQRVST